MTEPFLRIPPFPGSRSRPLAAPGKTSLDGADAGELARLLSEERVGGVFWGSRPKLPKGRDLLLVPASATQAAEMLETARTERLLDRCAMIAADLPGAPTEIPVLRGTFDWWHLVETSDQIWVDADRELALVAGLAKRPVRLFGDGRFASISEDRGVVEAIRPVIDGWTYTCPFSGDAISAAQAIKLLVDWKRLIDRNRRLSAIVGVAGWKRSTVDAMLWDGANGPNYTRSGRRFSTPRADPPAGRPKPRSRADQAQSGTSVQAVRRLGSLPDGQGEGACLGAWKSRTPPELLDEAMRSDRPIAEIEDGLIRGRGLGANCVPPLSIVVDFSGIYFDPSQPSDLELILQSAEIEGELLARAARLRARIVEAGISKYGIDAPAAVTSDDSRRVLVVGQVEDDRSVLSGGAGQTNLELLERARKMAPDAWLTYRPHPDVEAGHRRGHIPDQRVLDIADEIERGGSISTLIESVDEVHCITSLAGFEALLRGKKVTTHGVPFYAGWGLTTDLGPIPPRRSRPRSLDELVAAAIILYPTHVDPVTRLPCPPEILVERIARGEDAIAAPLAGIRALQGKLKLAFRRLWEVAA